MILGEPEEHDKEAGRRPIRRALISVYDKTGLAELARGLHDAGVEIVSTGSTAKTIAGIPWSGGGKPGGTPTRLRNIGLWAAGAPAATASA